MWTRELVEIWIEYYSQLKNYELNFWQEKFNYRGEPAIRGIGSGFRAPFITQADYNIEFDLAIKKLGKLGERVFRLRYLDGYSLEDINTRLPYSYKDIKSSWYTVKSKLIKYLLEGEEDGH